MNLQHGVVLGWSTLHLRASFLMLTPLLLVLQAHFGLSHATIGMLTTLPLLVFAAVSPFVGNWIPRCGMTRLFGGAMVLLALGAVLRSYAGITGLFAGTVLLSAGVAIGNVLLPTLTKAWYPEHTALATGIFVVAMNGMNAVSNAIVIPLAAHYGWQLVCASWAATAFVGALLWFSLPNRRPTARAHKELSIRAVFSHYAAWWVALFMGLQSLVYFSLVTWLPYWVVAKGYDMALGGYYSFLFQLISLPASLLTPLLAQGRYRRHYGAAAGLMYLTGFYFVFAAQTSLWLTAAIIWIALAAGATFSLCMLAFAVRAANPLIASRLSGVGQAIAYLLAAIGPVGVGALYGMYGSWPPLLSYFIGACLLLALCGYHALHFTKVGEDAR